MPYSEIPAHARGTHKFGEDLYHQRLDQRGELMLVAGPDLRDWQAIDKGALDYTKIAAQEHAADPFQGHDGPKTLAACAICANNPTGEDIITARTRQLIAAKKAGLLGEGQTPGEARTSTPDLVGPTPTTLDADIVASIELRQAKADLAEQQARIDAREKELLTPKEPPVTEPTVTGAADPAFNAGIPPTDPDVVAGATPDIQAQTAVMGIDPFTGQTVKITSLPGADREAPYGRKADGSPRAKPGRVVGVPQAQ